MGFGHRDGQKCTTRAPSAETCREVLERLGTNYLMEVAMDWKTSLNGPNFIEKNCTRSIVSLVSSKAMDIPSSVYRDLRYGIGWIAHWSEMQ